MFLKHSLAEGRTGAFWKTVTDENYAGEGPHTIMALVSSSRLTLYFVVVAVHTYTFDLFILFIFVSSHPSNTRG